VFRLGGDARGFDQPRRVEQLVEPMEKQNVAAVRKRIEQPDFDLFVLTQCSERRPRIRLAVGIQVIDQQANAHPAIGGAQQLGEQHLAGVVFDKNVVLDVERPLGLPDELSAQQEPVHAARKQPEPRQARMTAGLRSGVAPEIRRFRLVEGRAGRFGIIGAGRGQRRTSCDEDQTDQPHESGAYGRCPFDTPDHAHGPVRIRRSPSRTASIRHSAFGLARLN